MLEEVSSFKYPEATSCKHSTCLAKVHIKLASAMTRLKRTWHCNTISFSSKFKLHKSLVTSMAVKQDLLNLKKKEEKKRSLAFQTKCLRNHLRISDLKYKTNDWVPSKISKFSSSGSTS